MTAKSELGITLGTAVPNGSRLWDAMQDNKSPTYGFALSQVHAQLMAWRDPVTGEIAAVNIINDGFFLAEEGFKATVLFACTGKMLPLPPAVRWAMQALLVQVDIMRRYDIVGFLGVHYGALEANRVPSYSPESEVDGLYKLVFGEKPPAEIWHKPLAALRGA